LSVITLHNEESTNVQAIATSDVVIATTHLIQQGNTSGKSRSKQLLQLLKRVHWHRIVVDEAHLNNLGSTKLVISALSATHRHSLTGTPIGAHLSDLYGQLRFLRLAPFCRPAFWKNLIEDPYYERDDEALRVLRSLLSRIVMRHSKRQTFDNGKSLLALPPRTVETVLLQFGSESEKYVYQSIEARNRKHFLELKRESLVHKKYLELSGMLSSARQACAHSSLVSLEKLDRFNSMMERRKEKEEEKKRENTVGPVRKQINQTREGLLRSAISQARGSAKLRMRMVMNQFQNVDQELFECPVCFEVVGEQDIAVPACAHLLCATCMCGILGGSSSTRDSSGHCPSCRDIMKRSEITFLGDATDAGTAQGSGDKETDEDLKPAAIVSSSSNSNGFQTTATSLHAQVSAAEASTVRASRSAMSDKDLRSTLHEDRALLHTLDEKFLTSYYDCEAKVGTKVARLLYEIKAMTDKSAKSKCVVFSQYIGVLDVAAEELKIRGIGFVRIDDSMKQHHRADALMEFSSNPNAKVFLLSMRSGAVGLTLTAADHCFIMDIAQNSAIEEQAIDRIHRIGQLNPVTVKRLVIEGTIEERLLGARRSLAVDRSSTGTICGAIALDDEETKRPAKRARTEDTLDDSTLQQRVEMFEKLLGYTSTVHNA
jgi:DNA repair protein RAD5